MAICTPRQTSLWVFSISVDWMLFAVSIVLIYKFISLYFNGSKKVAQSDNFKTLTISGFVFIAESFVLILVKSLWMTFRCLNLAPYSILTTLTMLLYLIQLYLVLFIFFNRLKCVFTSTPLVLSKRTAMTFKTILIALPFYFIFVASLYVGISADTTTTNTANTVRRLVLGLSILLIFTFIISLITLFIYKLIQVYKLDREDDGYLMATITRSTILAVTSITFSFLFPVCIIILAAVKDKDSLAFDIFSMLARLVPACDMFTNLVCILLSYKCFCGLYNTVCCCMDRWCKKCLRALITQTKVKAMVELQVKKHMADHAHAHEISTVPSTTGTNITHDQSTSIV